MTGPTPVNHLDESHYPEEKRVEELWNNNRQNPLKCLFLVMDVRTQC